MENHSPFQEIKTDKDLNRICLHNFEKLIILVFYAEWHEPSVHIKNVSKSLSKIYEGKCIFVAVNADEVTTVSEQFKIDMVPTVILMKSTKEVLFRYEEDNPTVVSQKVEDYYQSFKVSFEAHKTKMFIKIEEILKSYPIVIFIKGTPTNPQCGFSEQLLNALNELKIKYSHFNILSDEEIRNWLRYYSSWITYPQVYVNAKFVGGLDVTKDLIKQGKFQEMIANLDVKDDPESIIKKAIEASSVVAFIEGKIDEPATIRTEEIIRILNENGIRFASFNMKDCSKEISDYLQTKFNVAEVPFLFINKEPVGGLKTIKELSNEKKLQTLVPKDDLIISTDEKLKELINSNPVMLFMKGTPDAPQCGFSRKMIELLSKYNANFGYFNILADKVVRERLKEYSNWKTYPQLYVDGKLVGGIDIANELESQGEFHELIANYVK